MANCEDKQDRKETNCEASTECSGYHLTDDKGKDRFEFRNIHTDEIEQAVLIEQICFPPNEACKPEIMRERVKIFPETFLVAVSRETGKVVGFINGLAKLPANVPA